MKKIKFFQILPRERVLDATALIFGSETQVFIDFSLSSRYKEDSLNHQGGNPQNFLKNL